MRKKYWVLMATLFATVGLVLLTLACASAAPPRSLVSSEFKVELRDEIGLVKIYEITKSNNELCIMAIGPDSVNLEC